MKQNREGIDRFSAAVLAAGRAGGEMGDAALSANDRATAMIEVAEHYCGRTFLPDEIEACADKVEESAREMLEASDAMRRRARGPVLRVIQGGEGPTS